MMAIPIIRVKNWRNNSAKLMDKALCSCETSAAMRLVNSPTLRFSKNGISKRINLAYKDFRTSPIARSLTIENKMIRKYEKTACMTNIASNPKPN